MEWEDEVLRVTSEQTLENDVILEKLLSEEFFERILVEAAISFKTYIKGYRKK
jgi:hypothetical protein